MNQPITVTFVPEQVITWVIIGLIAGFLANLVVRGRGMGLTGNVLVGLVGAVIGGFLLGLLQIDRSAFNVTINLTDIIAAFIGAVIVLLVASAFRRR